jgi:choline dehydrogenase-like flavoprotein
MTMAELMTTELMKGMRTDDVDVVIVGSGPCGSAYARELHAQAPQARLLLVEVGPQISDPAGSHVKNIRDDARRQQAQLASQGPAASQTPEGRQLVPGRAGTFLVDGHPDPAGGGMPAAAMSSNVGGMGAHWTCACPRPGGSERIDFIPETVMGAALDRAEEVLGVSRDAFNHAPFSSAVRDRLGKEFDRERPPARRVQPMPLAVRVDSGGGVHWSGADVVLADTLTAPTVELLTRTLCRRVLVDERGRAYGVELEDLQTGRARRVLARWVVVAADALRTPQLLWASGVRPAALGRYLNDQPQVIAAVRLDDRLVAGHEAQARATGSGSTGAAQHSGVSWVPFDEDHPFHGQVMQLDASPIPLAGDTAVAPGSIVGLGWFCRKELRAEDAITFDDDAVDAYGMPAMRIHYALTDNDRAAIDGAVAAIRRATSALGTPLDENPIVLPAGTSLHYQGSTRMGAVDDGASVCDVHSQVWGHPGLVVAGNGVIPTSTACNPTLTSVALAVLGARNIAAELDRSADIVSTAGVRST